MLYRRGKVWWYEFIFEGRRIARARGLIRKPLPGRRN